MISSAVSVAACSVPSCSRSTANSSPPNRATTSRARRQAAEPPGDGPEQVVAGGVAEAVVDRLEAVEVDEQDGDLDPSAGGRAERLLDPVEEEGPVRQAGQRVVEGLVHRRHRPARR